MARNPQWYQRNKERLAAKGFEYRRTLFGKLNKMYLNAQQRVKGQESRGRGRCFGLPICSPQELYDQFLRSLDYITRYNAWVASGYQLKFSPSLDRIDNERGYTIDNIQILTQSENRRKQKGEKHRAIY